MVDRVRNSHTTARPAASPFPLSRGCSKMTLRPEVVHAIRAELVDWCGSPPAPVFALPEKLNYVQEGMVLGMNNLIFNFVLPPARTRLSDAILQEVVGAWGWPARTRFSGEGKIKLTPGRHGAWHS